MPSNEKQKYFDATADRETRDDLKNAVKLVETPKVAIDCGCGAGSDIAFLISEGFIVHGFDIEKESIERCQKRFEDDDHVHLSQDSFISFEYPSASLIVADASLFFSHEDEFGKVWRKINDSLIPNGIFCGSFLGPEDTMAGSSYNKEAYWPDVLTLSEEQVKDCFREFKVVSFTEHKTSGVAPGGEPHNWHIFSVVAKKESNNGN
ncbi:MAG: class I SAM-dependent methyltransferase [Gammaproteobacteria bacterium]|jgi:SAM-dependent methyltransferase